MKDLAGKTAFVTGAASGIGLGIAATLAQAGVKVMLCDIEEAALDRAVESLKQTNADVDGVKADVSVKAELKAAAETAVGRYGKVHILVNNAGVGGGGPYGAWTDAGWAVDARRQSDGRRVGNSRDFRPIDRATRRGRAHGVDSVDGWADLLGGGIPYHVSKYGVVALCEGLRSELAPRGIGVSVLCPGFVRTQIMDFWRNLPERFGQISAERLAAMRASDRIQDDAGARLERG